MRRTIAILAFTAWVACTVREHRPDSPYRSAEEFVDAFSDETVACTREHAPEGSGQVLIAAELRGEGKAPVIHDLGSSPGTDAILECVRQRAAEKLRCPAKAPAEYARLKVPLPLVTSEIKYAFVHDVQQ